MKDFEIPDDVYFRAMEAIRFIERTKGGSPEIVLRGAQIVAFSKKTNKRRNIFTAPTKKEGGTACYVFGKCWLYSFIERGFVNPENEQKYARDLKYARGFAYLLGKNYEWYTAGELNNKAYLFYSSLYTDEGPSPTPL